MGFTGRNLTTADTNKNQIIPKSTNSNRKAWSIENPEGNSYDLDIFYVAGGTDVKIKTLKPGDLPIGETPGPEGICLMQGEFKVQAATAGDSIVAFEID